jgi:transposase-like protein
MKLSDFEKSIYQYSKSKKYAKGHITDELYQAAFSLEKDHSVAFLCQKLNISSSTYYKHKKRIQLKTSNKPQSPSFIEIPNSQNQNNHPELTEIPSMAVCDIQMKNKDKTLLLNIPVNQISNVLATIKDMMQ